MNICAFYCFGITKNENDNFILENDVSSEYLGSLNDRAIEKMIKTIRKKGETEKISDFDYLLSCGYPEEFLKAVTDSTLKRIVSSIGNNQVSDVRYKTEYPDSNKNVHIESVAAKMKDKENGDIVGETVCIYWEWTDKKPLINDDYFSVEWSEKFFVYEEDSFYAEDYYKENTADAWTVSDSRTTIARITLNSIGHFAEPKVQENIVGGSMVFGLLSKYPIETADDKNINYLEVQYTHQYELLKTVILIVTVLASIAIVGIILLKNRRKRNK